mgnify:CR=1 FL=1
MIRDGTVLKNLRPTPNISKLENWQLLSHNNGKEKPRSKKRRLIKKLLKMEMLEISEFLINKLTLHSVCFTRSGLTICKDTNMVTIDNTGNKVLYLIENLKYNTNPYQYQYYSLDNSLFNLNG